jgi:hypothetical protein
MVVAGSFTFIFCSIIKQVDLIGYIIRYPFVNYNFLTIMEKSTNMKNSNAFKIAAILNVWKICFPKFTSSVFICVVVFQNLSLNLDWHNNSICRSTYCKNMKSNFFVVDIFYVYLTLLGIFINFLISSLIELVYLHI